MLKNVNNIVIVGGGSAGWMSAAYLIKFFPNLNISLVESPDFPIVGVGESTLLSIRDFTHKLGLKDEDFMQETDASYKMSIKFTDFYEINDGGFHYPFGNPEYHGKLDGIRDWFVKKALYPKTENNSFAPYYYPSAALYENNKFCDNKELKFGHWNPKRDTAFHFDAIKFGQFLKNNYCLPRGVKLIENTVSEVVTDTNGVSKLVCNDGLEITADLYLDCTGFKSMLLTKALKVPFHSWEKELPNNRAWATRIPYKDKDRELEPFTNCTAIQNGWVWNIPSWSRIGTGYVYSDNFINPEDAKEEFKQHLMSKKTLYPRTRQEVDELEFKDIPMRVGLSDRIFEKNVVGIGLSAGFIEPLESNGLYTVTAFLDKLVKLLLAGSINQFDKDTFNLACTGQFKNFKEFVAMHYAFTSRTDTEYWRSVFDKTFDEDLYKFVPTAGVGYFDYADQKNFLDRIDVNRGLIWIASGMNHHIIDKLDVINSEYDDRANYKELYAPSFSIVEKQLHDWNNFAKHEKTLNEYLKSTIYCK